MLRIFCIRVSSCIIQSCSILGLPPAEGHGEFGAGGKQPQLPVIADELSLNKIVLYNVDSIVIYYMLVFRIAHCVPHRDGFTQWVGLLYLTSRSKSNEVHINWYSNQRPLVIKPLSIIHHFNPVYNKISKSMAQQTSSNPTHCTPI